jgi:hypothetical protein
MKSFLSGVGSFLIGVIWFAGIILLFVGGAKVGSYVAPWLGLLAFIAVILLLIGLPICLVLLIFRKTRRWGGAGIYFLSWPLGLWLWVASFVYATSVSLFWAGLGIILGGLGVIPIAAIMTLIRRDWENFGGLVGTLIVVLILRFVGFWVEERAEEREQEEAFLTEQSES